MTWFPLAGTRLLFYAPIKNYLFNYQVSKPTICNILTSSGKLTILLAHGNPKPFKITEVFLQ